MLHQIFLSPQVKRCTIITYKHGIYVLPHDLPNDLRFSKICQTFSKIIFSRSFLSYSRFCVNIFSKNFPLFVPVFGHVTVKNFIEY